MDTVRSGHEPGVTEDQCFSISFKRIVFFVTFIFITFSVLDGPLRYFLALSHFEALSYIPKALLLLALLILVTTRKSIASGHILIFALIFASAIWGAANLPKIQQPFFELWVILPFLFGLYVGRFVDFLAWRRLFFVLFLVSSFGVILNPIINYPWSGQSFAFFSHQIQISRYWAAFGLRRYAGFSRASFTAASQILLFSLILFLTTKSLLSRLSIWFMGFLAIIFTTSKGILAAWLLLSIFFAGGYIFRWARFWFVTWLSLLTVLLIAAVALPLSTLFIKYSPSFHSLIGKILFTSFGERLTWMWPSSLGLLSNDGIHQWLIGRGIGGIGAAQLYFNPSTYLAADNLFVYAAVTLGPPIAIYIFFVIARRFWIFFWIQKRELYLFPIFIMVFTYAMVANMNGQPVLNLFFGILLSKLFYRTHRKQGEHCAPPLPFDAAESTLSSDPTTQDLALTR